MFAQAPSGVKLSVIPWTFSSRLTAMHHVHLYSGMCRVITVMSLHVTTTSPAHSIYGSVSQLSQKFLKQRDVCLTWCAHSAHCVMDTQFFWNESCINFLLQVKLFKTQIIHQHEIFLRLSSILVGNFVSISRRKDHCPGGKSHWHLDLFTVNRRPRFKVPGTKLL